MTGVLLWSVAAALVLATVLPLSKIAFGAVQGLSFPRAQFLCAALVCGALFVLTGAGGGWMVGAALMAAVAAAQALYIAKFTPFWPRQSVSADQTLLAKTQHHVSMLSANVKMSNRDYARLIRLVQEHNPDVLMAIEVDQAWVNALRDGLAETYPHWIEEPRDNGYGICILSRLALEDSEVRDLVTQGVPSVRSVVRLRGGQAVRLYVVHPEPPIINHDTIGRDSEIALVGLEAASDPLPAIVTGDLNDVAWSTTTRRFQRLSQLLDPRVGRGFYNTFSATHPWMRWPLDHLFHDKRFRLIEMARLGKIGSDHFPMWFVLGLTEEEAFDAGPGQASAKETDETKQMIRNEQARDRGPIGAEWERDEETRK